MDNEEIKKWINKRTNNGKDYSIDSLSARWAFEEILKFLEEDLEQKEK